jgi:hypothetical protein
MDEIMERCGLVADTVLEDSLLPKDLFPKNYKLEAGAKLLIINGFLTTLAIFGDLEEDTLKILIKHYHTKLFETKKLVNDGT